MPNLEAFAGDDIAAHVPLSLKQKIWAGNCINLALLTKGSAELQQFASSTFILSENGELEAKPKMLHEHVTNIDRWTNAFLIFLYVYTLYSKAPGKSIRTCAVYAYYSRCREEFPGMGWRNYEEQFRLHQVISYQNWSKLKADLWLGLIAVPPWPENNQTPTQVPTQAGVCFSYNRGRCNATNCRYAHVCSICKGKHPKSGGSKNENFRNSRFSRKVRII